MLCESDSVRPGCLNTNVLSCLRFGPFHLTQPIEANEGALPVGCCQRASWSLLECLYVGLGAFCWLHAMEWLHSHVAHKVS